MSHNAAMALGVITLEAEEKTPPGNRRHSTRQPTHICGMDADLVLWVNLRVNFARTLFYQ